MFVLCVLSYTFLTLLVVMAEACFHRRHTRPPFLFSVFLWGASLLSVWPGGYGRYIVTNNAIYTSLLPQPLFVSHFVFD
ncbi:hypothetical protein BO86DRAFT_63274 [Aspergillus japonicus CBS 114.51]|uniref:Uncharacterized protein n=2 Tax=Aspergillus TaxID=5052 RepID=A0A2V5HNW6_ASPV1|nr:hypothetical protein BO86DRAFT_63274 [Aspergillus japonicus CBS 114.51]PYI24302.1 hypothetical protein BO99DRAFT_91062 [Aspergillus violaceofuscus CBS 115571]RAH82888.1 hypothetical protein BO86DRAFT_63274 [Aspergillus japonicus CBS 114.51]